MFKIINKVLDFIKYDVWRISTHSSPLRIRLFIIPARIVILAFRGFTEDKVKLRASALTYFSLLSVVPLVAMGFGVAKGFGIDRMLQKQLSENLSGQQEVIDWVIKFANNFLENTQGGLVAGIGIVVLLWAVMKVFGNIEESFNAIWQVHKPRSWPRKISDYLTMMLVAPILLILATSVNVFIATQITKITQEVSLLGHISPLIFFLIKLIPYFLFWLVLTVIYMVMPNTKVSFKSAFIAGVLAGSMFVLVQWVYIYFQVGVSKYNAIYGSFAALPLFLIWLQTSWLIVLFGAEVSFAVQNVEKYEFDPDIHNISLFSRKVLTIMVVRLVIKRFVTGETPLLSKDISQQLQIPIRLVRDIIYNLVDSGIFVEVSTPHDKEKAYQPARDVNSISVSYLLKKLDHHGADRVLAVASDEKTHIEQLLKSFDETILQTKGAVLIKDL